MLPCTDLDELMKRLAVVIVSLALVALFSRASAEARQEPRPPTLRDASPSTAPASQPAIRTHEAIEIKRLELPGPLVVTVAKVDLTKPGVKLVARPATRVDPDGDGPFVVGLQTVRTIAKREKLELAINGNFFAAKDSHSILGRKVVYFVDNPAKPMGWLNVDGKLLHRAEPGSWGTLTIDANGKPWLAATIARDLPAGTEQAISGSALVLRGGRVVPQQNDAERAPRSCIGFDAARTTAYFVAVDGRRPDYSVGVTLAELSKLMKDQGATDALNLDGGGSTTLVAYDRAEELHTVLNKPSDGHDLPVPLSIERPVADALGVVVEDAR
jgi:hypothetical protein